VVGPALTVGTDAAFSGVLGVVATDPDVYFTVEMAGSVAVRRQVPTDDMPCLRGRAVELIEALSIRSSLPAGTPAEWRQLMNGLATVFDSEPE
jgi:hypothetical protein